MERTTDLEDTGIHSPQPSADMKTAAVLGAGAWGTTFAQILADAGMSVTMWARNPDVVDFINSHENSTYLPGIILSDSITATTDLQEAVKGADLICVAVPVAAVKGVVSSIVDDLGKAQAVIALSKGLEWETHRTVHDVICGFGVLPSEKVAVVTGPNLSREIAERKPAATVIACTDANLATRIARASWTSYFRPYVSTDVLGCEIAGATKNVISIAIGAVDGLGLGANTRGTLISRGLAEMTRLGTAVGANPETFSGLAGIGDLVATCSSRLSRNYSLGFRMGQGASQDEALSLSPGVAEGAYSARPILELANSLGVDMPITKCVVQVLDGQATIKEMGEALLARPQKMDGWRIELV